MKTIIDDMMANGFATVQFGSFPFITTKEGARWSQKIADGRYATEKTLADDKVRTVIDFGARCGEFGVWAAKRWPQAWIDSVEESDELRFCLHENATPGGRVHTGGEMAINLSSYDVIRIGSRSWLDRLQPFWDVIKMSPILIVDVLGWGIAQESSGNGRE